MGKHRLDQTISVIQWFIFLVINTLLLPVMVGEVFQLSPADVVSLIQRSFFVVGLSSLLSGWLGHRLPIADGPAGIWLGVFMLTGQMAALQGLDPQLSLRLLEGGMLVTGATVIIVGCSGWMTRLTKVFTSLVTGVYLVLLSIQLTGAFLQGMIGANNSRAVERPVDLAIASIVFLLVIILSLWGRGWVKNFSILLGVLAGWIALATINGWGEAPASHEWVKLPELFAWGMPRMNGGMAVTAFIISFIIISSVFASIAAMSQAARESFPYASDPSILNRGGIAAGFSNLLSGLFAVIGPVPVSISAGFVKMSGQKQIGPYLVACLALIAVSFVPGLYSPLSLLPSSVAYAALLASYTQIIGFGLRSILSVPLDERRLTIVGMAIAFGTAVMFLPPAVFRAMPLILEYLASNGVIVGMLTALLMERLWKSQPESARVVL